MSEAAISKQSPVVCDVLLAGQTVAAPGTEPRCLPAPHHLPPEAPPLPQRCRGAGTATPGKPGSAASRGPHTRGQGGVGGVCSPGSVIPPHIWGVRSARSHLAVQVPAHLLRRTQAPTQGTFLESARAPFVPRHEGVGPPSS